MKQLSTARISVDYPHAEALVYSPGWPRAAKTATKAYKWLVTQMRSDMLQCTASSSVEFGADRALLLAVLGVRQKKLKGARGFRLIKK
jgi:hypothetical protein